MNGPLSSLRAIEFCGLGPAPLAGQLLADMGAQVTVIDRVSGPQDAGQVNRRGKQSLAVNLKSEKGCGIVKELMADTDIVIEGFRPGVIRTASGSKFGRHRVAQNLAGPLSEFL